ncbi:MAG: peptidase S41 [Tannerella sp.]|nr:peptidase S41 [Tannerella sp.]
MKKHIFAILISVLTISANCQTRESNPKFNLDFEDILNEAPQGWFFSAQSGYSISLDSVNVQSEKYSVVIEHIGGDAGNFQAVSLKLPNNYDGERITLSGHIKTENVTDGYAGLWMRIDPQIAFDNMGQRGITGTTDWTKHEITLSMNPEKTTQIVIGGLLVGKGKMWIDNLAITIDGKDIGGAKIFERKPFPAEKDKEFDNGSAIIFPPLNEQKTNDLELLGKLWGFLKYHHSAVGKGNYNWDYELFRILPAFLKAENSKKRDKILLDWINKYGKIPVCKTCEKTPSEAYIKPDLSWVEKTDMNEKLKKKIREIYTNRHQGEHYYIKMAPGVGNPDFSNENPYSKMTYPDAGFRLLALYKYWNMIHYFFPYKYLTDKNWDNILKEYIPIFISAKNRLEYELAAIQIIGDINDTHANLWGGRNEINNLRGNNFAPFRVQFVEQKLVVTDYYNPELKESSGLKTGDIITHINGNTVESIVDSIKNYYPASNKAARLRDISADLLRSDNKTINIRYISSGQEKQIEQPLYQKNSLNMYYGYKVNRNEKCYKLLDGNIGYVTLANIKSEDVPVIKESFKNTKGIIIDIRNYPSAFMPFSLAPYFVSKSRPFVKFTNGNVNNPGEFTFRKGSKIVPHEETYQGKLVVIVNEISQSSAEYTAMAFRAGDNTTIVGSTTAGADGNVSTILLPGGLQTRISGIGVYYPDGTKTQRIGIVPDILAEPTINGIKQGKDEILEKAIEIIEKR